MAKYIDIKDFEGALTNADLEDLPENVAQEIKNLKIQAGSWRKRLVQEHHQESLQ